MNTVLEVTNLEQKFQLTKTYLDSLKIRKGRLVRERKICHAVNGISFKVAEGETFSLVGESGCGKSTTARTVIKLLEPHGGKIVFNGTDITNLSRRQFLPFRKQIQMIFQDPYASLNPRDKVIDIVTAPMLLHNIVKSKKEAFDLGVEIFRKVGIREEQVSRFPHQFSGGQRQRIGIARALAVNPSFIVADEPVSALDVSIQAQILNLLMDLQSEFGFSYLFIAHDLAVVRHISNFIGVMYLGMIVEQGTKQHIFENPKHPYTEALLASTPRITGDNLDKSKPVTGEIPSPVDLPSGCYFHDRCPYVKPECREIMPPEKEVERGHWVSCHLY
ncbi:MAG: ATP-binding cassette domain-containing protein [Spirochaetales bacterium]|nr:ATP-binding cassette domain-containing protein [Spirochaetales bacterium]